MRKIWTIAQREYTSRVLTPTFWISVILLPIGISLLVIIPVLAALNIEKEKAHVLVVDDSGKLLPFFEQSKDTFITWEKAPISRAQFLDLRGKHPLGIKDNEILLVLDSSRIDSPLVGAEMCYNGKVSIQVSEAVEQELKGAINAYRLEKLGFTGNPFDFSLMLGQTSIDAEGKLSRSSSELASLIGYLMSMLNYMMVFIYGMMVMRGVIEEKSSRIVEVILSSVKPMQLMAGKLIGICAVGLTQFILWVLLSFGAVFVAGIFLSSVASPEAMQEVAGGQGAGMEQMQGGMGSFLIATLLKTLSPGFLLCFLFFFLAGYFLYGSLFAAVGSAVDQEADAQQLTWPVTIPLIIPMLLINNVLMNPNGSLATFLSLFPFSSPTIMMIRLAATDVPLYQVLLSMVFLLMGIVICLWIAARIYRTGILLYGKKVTVKELGKWIFRS